MGDRKLRNTPYAKELASPAGIAFPDGSEGRLEYLQFKTGAARGKDGYRFSWWREGRMLPRPLDLTEEELLKLLKKALQKNVFSYRFVENLRTMLRR